MRILIIGGGNMGAAMAGSLAGSTEVSQVTVCEKDEGRWSLFEGLNVLLCRSLTQEVVSDHSMVIMAVKPQDVDGVLSELAKLLQDQLVISIAAGITIGHLGGFLDGSRLVRAMPNTPALVGEAITGWVSSKGLSNEEKKRVRLMLKSFGEEIELVNEELLNAVTALSGCGPGYMFYILRQMVEAGVSLGLAQDEAKKLAIQTMKGSSLLAANSADDLLTLQQKVASKGGSTEAAIDFLEEKGFGKILKEAMRKAFERARELGGQAKG